MASIRSSSTLAVLALVLVLLALAALQPHAQAAQVAVEADGSSSDTQMPAAAAADADDGDDGADDAAAAQYMAQAAAMVAKRKPRKAALLYKKAMKADPTSVDAVSNYGGQLLQMKRYKHAAKYLKQAVDMAPTSAGNAKTLQYLGMALKELGELQDAANALQASVQRKFNEFEAHYQLADTLLEMGKYGEAASAFELALSVEPSNPAGLFGLGHALFLNNKAANAIAKFKAAATSSSPALTPEIKAKANYYLARAMEAAGRIESQLLAPPEGVTNTKWRKQSRAERKQFLKDVKGKEKLLVLSYETGFDNVDPSLRTRRTDQAYEFCRTIYSAAHNRVWMQFLGRGDDWHHAGQKLQAVLERLTGSPTGEPTKAAVDPATIVLFVDGEGAVFVDHPAKLVEKYLQFGRDAWVFAGSCNCMPFLALGANRTCDRLATDGRYKYLNAGGWMARAGTVVRVLRDALANYQLFTDTPVSAADAPTLDYVTSDSMLLASYFLSNRVPEMVIDDGAELFQSFGPVVYPTSRWVALKDAKKVQAEEKKTGVKAAKMPLVGLRVHTNPDVLEKCSPADDIAYEGPSGYRVFNSKTVTEPSILLFPQQLGDDSFAQVANRQWFMRDTKPPGGILPGREFPRNPEVGKFNFEWSDNMRPSYGEEFHEAHDTCRELFRS